MCVLELSDVSMFLFNITEKQKWVEGTPKNLCDYCTYPKSSACSFMLALYFMLCLSRLNPIVILHDSLLVLVLKTWVSLEKRKSC